MLNWKNLCGGVALSAIATAAIVAPAQAQVTSSAANGVITDDSGNAVGGATVTFRHLPTGTTRTATSSANGVFFESGLPIGGPYTISVSAGDLSAELNDVTLQPGRGNSFPITATGARTLDVITVVGSVGTGLDLNNGVGSIYSSSDILNTPTTTRDVISTLNFDPLVSGAGSGRLSVAGTNPRFNALAIDGSLQGNDFGLGSSTYATSRSPISLDAVESVSVAATDYSVTTSGFTGGLINVTTKSGTNDFDGAISYYRQDEDYFGNTAFDQFVERPQGKEEEYGFALGGPIVEDKLFFFVNYEKFESESASNFAVQDTNNNIEQGLFDGIADIVQNAYNYDIGARPVSSSNPEFTERYLGKLDWNINEDHRASFTYQKTEESSINNVSSTNFSSAHYTTPIELTAYTGQLNSDWTNSLSTELRINYKELEQEQNCNAGSNVGEFEIRLSEADIVNSSLSQFINLDAGATPSTRNFLTIRGGCDQFRHGNTFSDERLQVYGAANYIWGDHLFTFGGEYQTYELDNLFAQRSSGRYTFETLEELQNQTADVQVRLPASGNREDIRATWGYNTISLFAADSWQITPDFRLDYGLRYEVIDQSDSPEARQFFQDTYGFSNNANLDGIDLLMPRLGFEYNPLDRTKLTGGLGLYAGGSPTVWVSNAFTPPAFDARDRNATGVNPSTGVPEALLEQIRTNNASTTPSGLDLIDPDFEMPSDWKASLRLDQGFDLVFGDLDLGSDYIFSTQVLYTTTNQGFRWTNLAQTNLESTRQLGTAPDGRPIYADLDDLGLNNAIQLTNFDDADSWVYSVSLGNDFDNGFGFLASYAYQDVETVTPGTSSRGISNLRATVDTDRNNPSAGRAPFEVEHNFKLNLSYEREFFGDLTSRFNLFGNAFSGDPISYTFDVANTNSLFGRAGNGETPRDNDLLYVPTIENNVINDALVVTTSDFDEAGFVNFVQSRGLGSGIQERGGDEGPWTQRWDFQWQQELPIPGIENGHFAGHELNFVLDIQNIGNLINDEWGTQFNAGGATALVGADLISAAQLAGLEGTALQAAIDNAEALDGDSARTTCTTTAACVYRFDDFRNSNVDRQVSESLLGSVYEVRVGLRYTF